MKSIKTFIYVFKKSLTEPKYYQHILKTPFWFSLKYLLILNLVLMLIESVIIAATVLPTINRKTEPVKNEIIKVSKNLFPRELKLVVTRGQLSTNVKEPYFVNPPVINMWLKNSDNSGGSPRNLITIDTNADIGEYEKYQTVFLLTKNSVAYPDRQNSLNTYKITQFPNNLNFYIDYAKYNKYHLKFLPYINLLPKIIFIGLISFLIIMPWFGAILLTIGNLFYLFWTTCLFWLIFKIQKKTFTYYQIFRLGMHGITIVILVGTLAGLLKIDLGIGLFISFIVWMVYVFKNISFQVNNG